MKPFIITVYYGWHVCTASILPMHGGGGGSSSNGSSSSSSSKQQAVRAYMASRGLLQGSPFFHQSSRRLIERSKRTDSPVEPWKEREPSNETSGVLVWSASRHKGRVIRSNGDPALL